MYNSAMQISRQYTYEGKVYAAKINFRRQKSLTLRVKEDGVLSVGAPLLTPVSAIDAFVNRSLPKLLKRVNALPKDMEDDSYYLFGQKLPDMGLNEKQIKAYLRKELLSYVTSRTVYYESKMGVHPAYSVAVRDMSSRYGVNSIRTRKITYALSLAHYSRAIIDAIVVHELAHHFQRNHSSAFYKIVYQYCPDYDILHTKLRKHIHA